MKYKRKRLTALVLVLALVLGLLASCGSKAKATTMHLRRTEGKVRVSDSEGKSLEPEENLGLYSGYGVDTKGASYAWIDLDEVKLTKLDENSKVEVVKEDKHLTIDVKSGGLFFNVTEPLADDETMDIRSSTMLVGIRGTCGWVSLSEDGESLSVYLLEGKVRCEADGSHKTVRAGEKAVMTKAGEIAVAPFTAADIPSFVVEEIEDDDDLIEAILDASGIDVLNPVDPQDDIDRRAALLEVLSNNSGASYAGLFDMDQDGRDDLLLLHKVGQYSAYRWAAYIWDGSEVQTVNLTCGTVIGTTDDIYTVTAGIYRERATGTPYVRYYGEAVGGAYSNYFVGMADLIEIAAPFWGGGMHGETEEEYQAWRQQKEQEQREYEADLANRFETIVELDVGGFTDVKDYTYTIGEVRQRLTEDAGAPASSGGQPSGGSYEVNGTLELAEGTTRLRDEEIYQDVVVRDGQILECERTTIYGSVRVEYGGMVVLERESTIRGSVYVAYVGHISLRGESTICGEIHIDGGGVSIVNSTVEGDVYANDTRLDNGNIAGSGGFHMTGSRAAKNIYVGGVTVSLVDSTVDGYIDVNNSENYRSSDGRAYGCAELYRSTVNGQWYKEGVVVYEIQEGSWYYNNDEVTIIMGRTP